MSSIQYTQFCLVCQVSTFWALWFDVILYNLKFSGAPRKCIDPFAKVETKSAAAAKSRQSHPTLCDPIDRPWDSPGKNNGVGFHFLLQCMKVKSQSKTKSSPLVNLLQADAPELCRIADSRKTEENQKPRNLPPSAEFPYLLVKSLWWPFHKCAN